MKRLLILSISLLMIGYCNDSSGFDNSTMTHVSEACGPCAYGSSQLGCDCKDASGSLVPSTLNYDKSKANCAIGPNDHGYLQYNC